jgi:hypothetical protein
LSSPHFTLKFTPEALKQLEKLEQDKSLTKRLKAVRKTLGLMETNLRHPSLRTHEYTSLTRVFGWKVFEAYAESNTPAAYRILWHYGPKEDEITVLTITRHQ